MKLFKHSATGIIVAFGFNMQTRKEGSRSISWSDPDGSWDIKSDNQAGNLETNFNVDPEFIFERANQIVAYQPGCCIVMEYIGLPLVWSIIPLTSDGTSLYRLAA